MFAKLVDGKLEYAPDTYKVMLNGLITSQIFNFNKNEEIMNEYGFKEVLEVVPDYNASTQSISIASMEETDDSIIITYEVYDKETTESTVSDTGSINMEEIENEITQRLKSNINTLFNDNLISFQESIQSILDQKQQELFTNISQFVTGLGLNFISTTDEVEDDPYATSSSESTTEEVVDETVSSE